jgi:hypothetical protein
MTNTEPVRPGEEARFTVQLQTPERGAIYTVRYEVRLAGGVLVPPPLEVSFYVFE